jgi:hypothetical protein
MPEVKELKTMQRTMSQLLSLLLLVMMSVAFPASSRGQWSPDGPKTSIIYAIGSDGTLDWYRHDGATTGVGLETQGSWRGKKSVGTGWNAYTHVLPGGGDIIYDITADGTLEWRKHRGFEDGIDRWEPPKNVGRGWDGFVDVFSGGSGVIYVIQPDGTLKWHRHLAYRTGQGLETPGAWATSRNVGRGWDGYKKVFSGGQGVIYAITNDGTLKWLRHKAYLTGEGLETPGAWEGPKDAGRGWGDVQQVFSSGDGVIYTVTQDGKLWWLRHYGYLKGLGLETPGAWSPRKEVGRGWGEATNVFALFPFNDSENKSGLKSDTASLENRPGVVQPDNSEPPDEELRCRGGGKFSFDVVEGRINSNGEQTSYVVAYFVPAPQPAGASARDLQPGQCAFVNRTVRHDEPYNLHQEIVSFGQTKQKLHGTPVDTSPTAAERFPDAQNIPLYMNDPKHYWSFFVHQTAPLPFGLFITSAGRYWKPTPGIGDVVTQPVDNRRVTTPTKP